MPEIAETREVLAGLVERVTFHNEENGFCVLRVKARGHRDLLTVIGHAASISAGEWVTANGIWQNDRTHGLQFRAQFLKTSAPTSIEGMEKYLSSGMIRGIGPVYAKRLIKAFSANVFDVIQTAPERLREVEGIGPRRAERIVAAWAEQKIVREIMVSALPWRWHVASRAHLQDLWQRCRAGHVRKSYRLAKDIRGIGFKTADAIAARLGIEKTAMIRIRAGISYALTEALNEGHCGLPVNELHTLAEKLLEVPAPLIETAITLELGERSIVRDSVESNECLFLSGLYQAEKAIGGRLLMLAAGQPPWPEINVDKAIEWLTARSDFALAESQKRAVELALTSKVLVITGGPGIGKTTIVNSILRILKAKHVEMHLCAPTGRAAKRMSEATGLEAKTIHRLLEVDPKAGGFRKDQDNPLDTDLLVADESSMIDVPLMHALLKAVPNRAALLIVGDIDQLPSVGPGQVLADLIGSGAVPVVRLTEVFRQAAQSRIVTMAHRINRGELPDFAKPGGESDYYFIEAEEASAVILELVRERIPKRFGLDPIRDIQVLCPMNRGGLGARSLNVELQKALNPPGADKIEKFGSTFAPKDKVMQIENDYDKEVYNGDIGFVTRIDAEEGQVFVSFDGRKVAYESGELDSLVLAYATTIHKAQGSEYPAVIMPLATQHYAMLQRNLLYTGLTRGKRLVVIVGQKKAVAIAVRNVSGRRRSSKLREWLAPN